MAKRSLSFILQIKSEYMYPREDKPKISQVNPIQPDYEKFPLLKRRFPIE